MGEAGDNKKFAGVALFGKALLDADVRALDWACKRLPLSDDNKLRIIHVFKNEPSNDNGNNAAGENAAQDRPGSRYDDENMETKFKEIYPSYSKSQLADLQDQLLYKFKNYICGVTYEGPTFEAALQLAVEKESLDILVLAWSDADDSDNKRPPPITRLESENCSIVLAKVGSSSKKLTFSMPPPNNEQTTDDTNKDGGQQAGSNNNTTPAAAANNNKRSDKPSNPSKKGNKQPSNNKVQSTSAASVNRRDKNA